MMLLNAEKRNKVSNNMLIFAFQISTVNKSNEQTASKVDFARNVSVSKHFHTK